MPLYPQATSIPTYLHRPNGGGNPEANEPPFDWGALVPFYIHPLRVAIIEALLWIDKPLSATDVKKLLDDGTTVGLISYHVKELAATGAIRKVRSRQVRGARETFYRLAAAR